jgi:hypothetical protein
MRYCLRPDVVRLTKCRIWGSHSGDCQVMTPCIQVEVHRRFGGTYYLLVPPLLTVRPWRWSYWTTRRHIPGDITSYPLHQTDVLFVMYSVSNTWSSGKNWSPTFVWYDTGHIENNESNNSYIVACVFVTAVKFLPSRCLATIRGHTYRHTDWWEGYFNYAVVKGSRAMIYVPSFINIGSGIQKLKGGLHRHTDSKVIA